MSERKCMTKTPGVASTNFPTVCYKNFHSVPINLRGTVVPQTLTQKC